MRVKKAYSDKRGVLGGKRRMEYTITTDERTGDGIVEADGKVVLTLHGPSALREILESQPATQLVMHIAEPEPPPAGIPDEAQHPGPPSTPAEVVNAALTAPAPAADAPPQAAIIEAPTPGENVIDWAARVLSPIGLSLGEATSSGALADMIARQDAGGANWRSDLGEGWAELLASLAGGEPSTADAETDKQA